MSQTCNTLMNAKRSECSIHTVHKEYTRNAQTVVLTKNAEH